MNKELAELYTKELSFKKHIREQPQKTNLLKLEYSCPIFLLLFTLVKKNKKIFLKNITCFYLFNKND